MPEEGVVFTGDNVFHMPLWLQECDPWEWLAALRSIEALDVETIIPGHGEPCGKAYLKEQAQIVENWVGYIERFVERGVSPEEILREPVAVTDQDPYPIGQRLFLLNERLTGMIVNNLHARILEKKQEHRGRCRSNDKSSRQGGTNMATLPYTGQEYLDSLDDGREVWIYGERVGKITEHPAFRNTARMIARLYDALHKDHDEGKNVLTCPTEWGGFTHRYFAAPRNADDLVAGRDAIAEWARITYGWLGRSPDYKAAFLATLGANAEFYAPYEANARHWYRYSQERVPYVNHAIVHPPVDRNMAPGAPGGPTDIYAHVTKETDAGIMSPAPRWWRPGRR